MLVVVGCGSPANASDLDNTSSVTHAHNCSTHGESRKIGLVGWLAARLAGWLAAWLGRLTVWLGLTLGWLAAGLVGQLVAWPACCLAIRLAGCWLEGRGHNARWY